LSPSNFPKKNSKHEFRDLPSERSLHPRKCQQGEITFIITRSVFNAKGKARSSSNVMLEIHELSIINTNVICALIDMNGDTKLIHGNENVLWQVENAEKRDECMKIFYGMSKKLKKYINV
jgi:hypothetical protein